MRAGAPQRRRTVRVLRLPGALGLVLAVPVLLALGAAALATFVVGVSALALVPRLRPGGRGLHQDDEGAVTLDRSAYRRVDDARDLVERERR